MLQRLGNAEMGHCTERVLGTCDATENVYWRDGVLQRQGAAALGRLTPEEGKAKGKKCVPNRGSWNSSH